MLAFRKRQISRCIVDSPAHVIALAGVEAERTRQVRTGSGGISARNTRHIRPIPCDIEPTRQPIEILAQRVPVVFSLVRQISSTNELIQVSSALEHVANVRGRHLPAIHAISKLDQSLLEIT